MVIPGDVQRLLNLSGDFQETQADQGNYWVEFLQLLEFGDAENQASSPGIMGEFYQWAANHGVSADPYNNTSVQGFFDDLAQNAEQRQALQEQMDQLGLLQAMKNLGSGGGGGGVGRTQFPEEAALLTAQTGLVREQTLSEEFGRGLSAAEARMGALQGADMDRRERLSTLLSTLLGAAPFAIGPEDKYFPGLEPGGVGQVLGRLLGANIGPREIPRTNLPLSMLMEAPLGGISEIDRLLSGVA